MSLKSRLLAATTSLSAGVLLSVAPASAASSEFTVQSVPDNFTLILGNGLGDTITVTGDPQNTSCFSVTQDGSIALFARTNPAACNQSLAMTFTTNGFDLQEVLFSDIDDMDGSPSRDAFAANVPGTWTSPEPGDDGLFLSSFEFASTDPAFADQKSRLSDAGAVGTYITRPEGDNPLDDTARFTLDTPTDTFIIFHDDIQGTRGARTVFDLSSLIVTDPIVTTDDVVRAPVDSTTTQTNVINVLGGDTIDGNPATTSNVNISAVGPLPAGITLNPDGSVDVAAGTPSGTYTFDYQICESGTTIVNCGTATVTISVNAPVEARNDSAGSIVGASATPNVLNVFDGDTINGDPATTSNAAVLIATGSSLPPELTFDRSTGAVGVAAGTPVGTYSFEYQVCEISGLDNCDTAIASVTVVAADVVATDDTVSDVNGASGATAVVNAFTGDTIDGGAASPSNATLTVAPGSTFPAELTFDPATGNVDVAPGTPAGTYSFDYQICETLNPGNCETATISVAVAVSAVVAAPDTVTDVNGTSGQADVLNVLAGDTINGDPATTSNASLSVAPGSTVPAGLSFDSATGAVGVSPNTPAGTYSFDYQICETLNPSNCRTATASVTVVGGPVTATNDRASDVNGAAGATAVVNAFTGDLIDGVAASPSNASLSVAPGSTVPAELTFDPATGNVDVAPGTPAGTYSFDYQICEDLNPTNCEVATIEVAVVGGDVAAANDSVSGVNGASGAVAVVNAFTGDTINGAPATAANATLSVAPGSSVPTGLSFDPATGDVDVVPNTPAGTYSFDYQICEDLNPANCETATISVTVAPSDIVVTGDAGNTDNGAAGEADVLNVLSGDTINGDPATTANATLSVAPGSSVPPQLVFDPSTGRVDVAPGTPSGTYGFDYQICETLNPSNCRTATASVTVGVADIAAVGDTVSGINGTSGADDVVNVLSDDRVNGDPATTGNAVLSVAPGSTVPNGLVFDPATGSVDVAPGTPAGTYAFDYQICEALNPSNCRTASVSITVQGGPVTATSDRATAINGTSGATAVVNAFAGDTINGDPATSGNAVLGVAPGSALPDGLVFDLATGNVDVAPGTPAGTYSFDYQICEALNPDNCQTATISVVVEGGPVTATSETATGANGSSGATAVANVLTGDTINGDPASAANATLSVAPGSSVPDGLVFDPATGTVDVAPGTPAGTYAFDYQICEALNPDNCATATVSVEVEGGPLTATPDLVSGVNGITGGTGVANVLDNDTLNGAPIDPDGVILTVTVADPQGALTLNPDGSVDVAPGTPAGTYTLTYEVCETLNPTNCQTATVSVTVEAAPIVAAADALPPVGSFAGGTTPSVLGNDTLNGAPIVLADITLTGGAILGPDGQDASSQLSLNADGTVTVAAGTPEGDYTLTYTICETLNPTNCATLTETITVEATDGSLSGIVYVDNNGDGTRQTDEPLMANWIVEVLDADGIVIATAETDANGFYEIAGVPIGAYSVAFRNPETNTVYGMIKSLSVTGGAVIVDQNLPIDPSGVLYDSVTRAPISGAVVTLLDAAGNPLPAVCFIDASQQDQVSDAMGLYRFDLVPGADAACPTSQSVYRIDIDAPADYRDGLSTVIGVEPDPLSPPAGSGPFAVLPSATAPQAGEATTYYVEFVLGSGSRDVINNHIPLDPIGLVRTALNVVKTTPRADVSFGDLVSYTITATNTEDLPRVDLDIVDLTPPGFVFVEGSARLDGVEVTPTVSGREVILEDFDFAANQTRTLQLILVVGSGVEDGVYTNQAVLRDADGAEVSNRGEATVFLRPDPLFDCAEVIGKVFDDRNKNGVQDAGEAGMAGVRVATVKGLLTTTDANGRYHITCAAIPNSQIGSNFIVKLDERTLPTGYRITTENPRVIRLTRGKISKLNFGTSLDRVVTLDLADAAFVGGGTQMTLEMASHIARLVDLLKAENSVLRLHYHDHENAAELARGRLEETARRIEDIWESEGCCYALEIERKLLKPSGDRSEISPVAYRAGEE